MSTATIEEVKHHLDTMIPQLVPGEPLIITENGCPVATLSATRPAPTLTKRVPGLWKNKATILVDDDEHLQGFEDDQS